MHISKISLQTSKELPSDAEAISHQLMLKAGLIKKVAAGLYTWLPLGLKVLKKVEAIVREEMDKSGALELLMPSVQPAELWQKTGRWQKYGKELLRLKDRHGRDFCFGPTHEEIITDLARSEIQSYKQLPICFYQIQTKFRDERRPRFGIMRAREFLMKDGYSFHESNESLQKFYEKMHSTYSEIFSRCGLEFKSVIADTGAIGGNLSHEFHVLAETGEDSIAFSTDSAYAANVELAEAINDELEDSKKEKEKQKEKIDTPTVKSISDLITSHKIPIEKTIKTLIVYSSKKSDSKITALILRGDHTANETKIGKLDSIASPFKLADEEMIQREIGVKPGSIGPVGLNLPIIVDRAAAKLVNFTAGSNEEGKHFINLNWGRDCEFTKIADIRNIEDGDRSPDGKGHIKIKRGIEVGHIFQLGNSYSESLNASVLDTKGEKIFPIMGCYGIGVSRIIGAAIEQNHDEFGIIWPKALSPFQVILVPIQMNKSEEIHRKTYEIYKKMKELKIEVLLDDRNVRPGVMFADSELIGIPHRLVISEKGLLNKQIEYKGREDKHSKMIPYENVIDFMQSAIDMTQD